MNPDCLNYRLSEAERLKFENDGYLIVENALSDSHVASLAEATDRVAADYLRSERPRDDGRVNMLNFIGRDDCFLELLEWPKTFAKVWEILGWNIQLYHSHMIVTPPIPVEDRATPNRLGWHQDSGRLSSELDTNPQPRVSLKVAFFLTDTTIPNCGNFTVVPGSHLTNSVTFPSDGLSDPEGAVPVQVKPGTAVFFDRRIWHAPGINRSDVTRKVLFYGYSYRWLRPRDNMTVEHYLDRSDPIRRQLLGCSPNGGFGYTSPTDEDVPLKIWIRENAGEAAVAM